MKAGVGFKVVRPGGLELPTFWFVAVRSILPNLARGVANRTDSASWGNFVQSAFSFFFRPLLRNCRYFPHLALRFSDSYRPSHGRTWPLITLPVAMVPCLGALGCSSEPF